MTSGAKARRSFTTLLAGCALACAAAASPRAEPAREVRKMDADYVVTWLGLPVYSAKFALEWNGERYIMRFRAEAEGIVRLAAHLTVAWETKGTFAKGQAQPERFEQANTFRRQLRRITLAYDGKGVPAVSIVPPESPGKRPPVPEPLKAGTLDPLSATLEAILKPADTARCGYSGKVFEGLRRTDVRLEHEAVEPSPVRRAGVDRQALVCKFYAMRLAGYEPKHFKQNPEPLPPAILWVAYHKEAGLWLPVELRFASDFGPIYATLMRVRVSKGIGE